MGVVVVVTFRPNWGRATNISLKVTYRVRTLKRNFPGNWEIAKFRSYFAVQMGRLVLSIAVHIMVT